MNHSSMWAISQGSPTMKIVHFERMGLNGLSSNLLILLESRLLRGREESSLLVHAPITLLLPHFTFYPLCFSIFSLFFLISLFPLFFLIFLCFLSCYFFSLVFPCSLLAYCCSFSSSCFRSLCTAKTFLYCLL